MNNQGCKTAMACIFAVTVIVLSAGCSPAPEAPLVELSTWEKGLAVTSPAQDDMTVYLWFYEWHMFEAIREGQHTHGTHKNDIRVAEDQRSGTIVSLELGLSLSMTAGVDSSDMTLTVTNKSDHSWPELASIIPCFNPGPEEIRNRQFANTKTFFPGPDGLARLVDREIHYNTGLRTTVDQEADEEGKYVWSFKWPESDVDSHGGLIVRESTDDAWVTGIAWNRFLSNQGHNPWECMHLSVNVGPLEPGESRDIRGKIYLFQGTKEELFERYKRDFG